jgi:hypothetical protein
MPSLKNKERDYIEAARREYQLEGEIEVDDNAIVSTNDDGEDGAYVQAWVWVPNEFIETEES